MHRAAIRAITFDLWDTVFIDDSDEPKRAAQGLAPKPVERRNLVQQFLERHEPISRELIDTAYDTADAAFHQVWYSQNVTWTVRERLSVLLKGLKRDLPEPEFNELVRLHEEMELAVRPNLAPDVANALSSLQGKYLMGVVSDAIFSPGRALRRLLADYEILKFWGSSPARSYMSEIVSQKTSRVHMPLVLVLFCARWSKTAVVKTPGPMPSAVTSWAYLPFWKS